MDSNNQRCKITTKEIDAILSNYRNIAAVNISPNSEHDSNKISTYMQSQGYHVYPICADESIILGEPVNRHLDDIRAPIDLVVIFGDDAQAMPILEQIKNHPDIQGFWIHCDGINKKIIQAAEKMGLKVVQDKCIMREHKRFISKYN